MKRVPVLAPVIATAIVAVLLVAALGGCTGRGDRPSDEQPQLLGVVTTAESSGEGARLLVVWHESLGPQLEYDAASLNVPEDADVFREDAGGDFTRITPDEIAVGDVVEVRITGPVAESYPVQATADQVVVTGTWNAAEPLPEPPGLAPPTE